MGRVAIAAARVDSQLALLLLAVKYPEPENPESLDVLRKWPTSRLAEQAQRILKRRFEGHMLDVAPVRLRLGPPRLMVLRVRRYWRVHPRNKGTGCGSGHGVTSGAG
jgi:hypothetical protein